MKKFVCILFLMFLWTYKNYVYSMKEEERKPIAVVVKVRGEVFILRSNNKIRAEIYMPLYVKDKIQTGSYSTMELIFDSGVSFKIEENCDIRIMDIVLKLTETKNISKVDMEIEIDRGGVLVDAQTIQSQYKLSSLRMVTPTATAAVRGTVFYTGVREDGKTNVAVFDGEVESYIGRDKEKDAKYKTIIKQDQQTSISEQTETPAVFGLSVEMMEYKNTVVKSFIADVQFYREKIETLKQKRQDWINKNKKDFEKSIEDKKRNFKKKYFK